MATQQQSHQRDEERDNATRSVLMVAHPGHELRVHGWLEKERPIVCVLTDGSGRTNHSRLDSTTGILQAADCVRGSIYGVMTDQDLYASILNFNYARFVELVNDLAALLMREEIDCIAGDAAEGYNPGHDVCRLIINGAVKLVNSTRSQPVKNFDFLLIGSTDECPGALKESAIYLRLKERALARKLQAARNYPELHAEVSAALSGAGSIGLQQHADLMEGAGAEFTATPTANHFAVECLRPVYAASGIDEPETPFYETYGERQVTAGHYKRVLRYREHVLPLAQAIDSHVQKLINS